MNPDNLIEQAVWVSDIVRKIYFIFQKIGKQKTWIRDAKGLQFIKLVIDPIITKLKQLLKKFSKYKVDNNFEEGYKITQLSKNLDDTDYCDKLKKDILKYTASKFSIGSKRKEIIEMNE